MYVLTTSCRKQIIIQRAINKFTSRKDTVSCEKKDKKLIRKRKFGSWLNICPHIPISICKWYCFNNSVQSVKFSLTWLNNNNYYDCWCIVEYKATSLADYRYLSAFIRCMVQKALILMGEKRFWTQVVNETHLWSIINLRVWIAIKIISNALTIKEEVSTTKEIPEIKQQRWNQSLD